MADAGVTRRRALAMIPCPNLAAREGETPEGLLRLTFPLAQRPWVARVARIMGKPEPPALMKTLELDELGTAVWRLLDGQRDVADLARIFAAEYGLHPREAELAVAAFLRELGRRGLVALVEKAPSGREAGQP